ncbi:MAG: potassium-transporting ATPase subunit KdpA [Candidatus Hydrogenedentes bacterium]|nr:potassium-transporting ATPase subunit KdpA [Candidatus Hydrogenedentota bacterium]
MSSAFAVQLILYMAVLAGITPLMGKWMLAAVDGHCGRGPLGKAERLFYRVCGVNPDEEMTWQRYAFGMMLFSGVGALVTYFMQRTQLWLPLNPQHMANVTPDSSFNTAVSFTTNTNWQGYVGEATMSYFTQMAGLAVHNFVSAAAGIAVAFALMRGITRKSVNTIGNVWTDLTRLTMYVLLPICFVFALLLISQGMIQNFNEYVKVTPLDPAQGEQSLAMGPVASQIAIKMLGTNGGGFFNANAAHPYENPNMLSNALQILAIFSLGAGLCYSFGLMASDKRQGWAIWSAMAIMFVVAACFCVTFEQQGNPALAQYGVDQTASTLQPGGNMEGKEARFGIAASSLFATITTSASCGAVNSMHASYTPLGGLVPMWLMQLGEVVYGGVGSGMYGMLVFVVVAVFVAGLMVGRTPEYLGKKIEPYEMKMAAFVVLVTPLLVLLGTAIAVAGEAGQKGPLNPGPHGFSEILYGFSSAANNNGSAFASLSANTPFYNTALGIAMWFGRFAIMVPVLAIAGSLARKRGMAVTAGTLPTHGPLFVFLLISTVLIVGALTYLPALALGPIAEQLLLVAAH